MFAPLVEFAVSTIPATGSVAAPPDLWFTTPESIRPLPGEQVSAAVAQG